MPEAELVDKDGVLVIKGEIDQEALAEMIQQYEDYEENIGIQQKKAEGKEAVLIDKDGVLVVTGGVEKGVDIVEFIRQEREALIARNLRYALRT